MTYLNLGCGSRYHRDWINIDIEPTSPDVIAYDLSKGIPQPDNSCDVVYHSHVLEHIRRQHAGEFIAECYRVLKPGGIIRVVVPDLERITRTYLEKLDAASNGDADAQADYEWIMLELYDQTVREQSGGNMVAYLSQDPLPNEQFIFSQIGEEARTIIEMLRAHKTSSNGHAPAVVQPAPRRSLRRRLARKLVRMLESEAPATSTGLTAADRNALAIGKFRLAGEVHQWMYDRYSLAKLLMAAGFQNPSRHTAVSSGLSDWRRFNLDAMDDGTPFKPDSLYMEAIKPMSR